MKSDKGQTFVEFILVFLVLIIASGGAFALYKTVWKNRYQEAENVSSVVIMPTELKAVNARSRDKDYVK